MKVKVKESSIMDMVTENSDARNIINESRKLQSDKHASDTDLREGMGRLIHYLDTVQKPITQELKTMASKIESHCSSIKNNTYQRARNADVEALNQVTSALDRVSSQIANQHQ